MWPARGSRQQGIFNMQRFFLRAAATGAVLLAAMVTTALADIKDYEFQLVDKEVKQGKAVIAIKLIHKPSGRAIPDAVIFAKRIDMGPESMEAMTAPLEAVPTTEPGVYRFKTDLTMAGSWALSLGAKVQGETGTVENKLIVKATE
jgi:YtkA-like